MNREQWLSECMTQLRPDFGRAGFALPDRIRCSCSWPSKSALALRKKRVGEAWSAECSGDEHFETFISPFLKDSIEVAATLVHELVHCAAGLEANHRGPFKHCARAIGLEGKLTATTAGEQLKSRLQEIIAELGEYPHAALDKGQSNAPPKQTVRQLKIICSKPTCGCVARITRRWLDEVGLPTCGCGSAMAEEEKSERAEKFLEKIAED